ncbi:MAG: PEP-utilizing enzyme [Pseudolysinimonas sp.]
MTVPYTIQDFVTDEFYPGYVPAFGHGLANIDPIRPFRSSDESGFWLAEGHWPRGITPLGYSCIEACAWGTQWAAQALSIPTGKGLAARMAATHVYNSEVPVTSAWEQQSRAARAALTFPTRIAGFPEEWPRVRDQLLEWLERLEQWDLDAADLTEIREYYSEAVAIQTWAWEQHFLFMYPLLANYFGLRGLCEQFGIDTDLVPQFLRGYDTKILETDRELWKLAVAAREAGIAELFNENVTIAALRGESAAANWLTAFADFLRAYGWRTEGMADPDLAPWTEDPTPALRVISGFLTGEPQDFDAIRSANEQDRNEAIAAAREQLTNEERAAFDASLAACHSANFSWWNEEHDFYIDLRVHVPLRRAALALGRAVGAMEPDDPIYLFDSEIRAVLDGDVEYSQLAAQIPARREHRALWASRRQDMPKVLGNMPEDVNDPVLKEIFGLGKGFFDNVRGAAGGDELKGVPASAGVSTGRARFIAHAEDLGDLREGEILVCEFTSPNWTPAFTRIAGCVADQGGALSHTAIVSREYRVPCVTGVAVGTNTIRTGDLLEVDGTRGVVRILERAVTEDVPS